MARSKLAQRSTVIYLIAALVPWLVAFGFTPRRQDTGPASWTLLQWRNWRDDQIRRILAPTTNDAGERVIPRHRVIQRCGEAFATLAPLLSNPAFLVDPERAKALGNFVKFVTAEHRLALTDESGNLTHGLAMKISDADYWRFESQFVTFPKLLESQPFLEALTNSETYESAVQMIERDNRDLPQDRKWVAYPFKSGFILSVDETTYGRLLIMIPNQPMIDGQFIDRWIQFAIATPDQNPAPRVASVSMISVVHLKSPTGSTKAYLSDFMRQTNPSNGEIEIKPNFLMKPNPSKVCIDCHKTAVIPIHPGSAYKFHGGVLRETEDGPIPDELNQLVERYGRTDFGPLDQDAYGPSLGATGPISDEFISRATSDKPLPATSYAKIREAMTCSKCHDSFAKINYLPAVRSDRDAKAFKSKKGMVQTFIESGWMPPRNTLTSQERHALWQCVMKSYFDSSTETGRLLDWLKGD